MLKSIAGASTASMLAGCTGDGDGGGDGGDGGGTVEDSGDDEQDTYTLKLAESANEANAHYKGSVKLAELAEEKSDGRIQIDVICCQQAGGPPEITESVQEGTLDMGLSAVNNLAGLTPAWNFVQLPYLWKDHEGLYGFFNEAGIIEDINAKAQENLDSIKINSYWGSGGGSFRHLHFSNDSTPKVTDDSDGEKVRVTESPVERANVGEWGFSPTPVAWSETVPAMKQGTVAGIHIHWWWLWDSGMWEQINYTVKTATQDSPAILHTNQETWDNLPSNLQDVLTEAINEAGEFQRQQDLEQGDIAEENIKDEKGDNIEIYEPTDSEFEQWRQITGPVYEEWLGEEGVKEEWVKAALEYQDYSVPGVDL